MSIEQVIKFRRTAHQYLPNIEVPRDLIHSGLKLALTAPNHKHTFPWHFVVAGPKTREKIHQIALARQEQKMGPLPEEVRAKIQGKILNPSALIAFCCKISDNDFQQREDYASVAAGIQNVTLFMAEHKFQCKWSTGALTTADETYQALQLDTDKFEICGFVWVGKPAIDASTQRRPRLTDCLVELS